MQLFNNRYLSFCRFLVKRFIVDQGLNSAAALTYTTLFAVVPMLTVTFAMLSVIPAFQGVSEQIEQYIFSNFIPSTGAAIQQYLIGFISQARQLTWVGVGVLMVTALLMLLTIEKAFNNIWRVHQPRRGISSFLLYWAVLSLGPLLMGAGFATTTYITSLSLLSGPDALVGAGLVLQTMPLALNVAAFTLIYAAVPNTRVPILHAMVGGAFTAVLLELARRAFGLYVLFFPSYELIYGAFAAVPLFLLWVYLSWTIVLFGAELVCGLSSSHEWRHRKVPRLLVALTLLRIFHDAQLLGRPVRLKDVQRAGLPLPDDEWVEITTFFEREKLACRTDAGGWILSRDLSRYSLSQLLASSPWPVMGAGQLPERFSERWYPPFLEAMNLWQEERDRLFGASLAGWLNREQEAG
ncbi:YihY family inner membrane protein [Stutzerimonas tarimensis]|uniref:UPF0761 membrane protein ACFOMF_14560 n=1 Tax=Stutzerimonas tarimensis TaxID=1507735 RepID=A0ABV7T7V9_9GAMM